MTSRAEFIHMRLLQTSEPLSTTENGLDRAGVDVAGVEDRRQIMDSRGTRCVSPSGVKYAKSKIVEHDDARDVCACIFTDTTYR